MFIKSLIPEIFLMFVRFSMCKIGHFFCAKWSFEKLHGMIGRKFVFIILIFIIKLRIEQDLLSL